MNTKQRAIASSFLTASLLISGCGPGQLLEPALTPIPTPILPVSIDTAMPEPSNNIASASLGTEFSLKPGQQMTISGENLTIKLSSVPNDSRCPSGVECFWEGNAEVNVELTKTGSSASIVQLNTAGITEFPSQANYLNYTIRVTELQPYPAVDSTIAQSDYTAKLIVSKQ